MSLEWFSLAGKVALVTGAAQGIGRAIAEAFAAAGARLVISDRQAEKLAHTATALTSQGYEVVSVPADVTYAGQVREMVEHGLGVYGALDILVNNAGGSGNIGVDDIEDVSEELWDEIVDTNLKSAYLCSRAVVPHMKARRQGEHHKFLLDVGEGDLWGTRHLGGSPTVCWSQGWGDRSHLATGQRPGTVRYPGQRSHARFYLDPARRACGATLSRAVSRRTDRDDRLGASEPPGSP